MNDAEWLEWRRGGIGGSDVAGIVGLSPWSSPYSVWARKVGLVAPPQSSEAMEFGQRAEPMLAQWLEDKTGVRVEGQQMRLTAQGADWMRCTVDGLTDLAVIEFKTTSDDEWADVPPMYRCQAQWNMAVADRLECLFGVLHIAHGRPRFRTYIVARDADDINFIIAKCADFWHDHVLTGTPPETDGSDATTATLNDLWADDGGVLDATDDLRAAAAERAHARREADRWGELAAAAENRIRAAMGDHDCLRSDGRNLATWRWQERRSVDMDALRAAVPDLIEQHTTTTRSRVLRVNHKE